MGLPIIMKLLGNVALASLTALASQAAIAQTVFTDAVPIASVIPSSAGNVIVGATVTTNANPAACPNAGFLLMLTMQVLQICMPLF